MDLMERCPAPRLETAFLAYIGFQREAARQTVREFVDKWLLTQAHWKDLPRRDVRVFFADEPIAALPELAPGVEPQAQH